MAESEPADVNHSDSEHEKGMSQNYSLFNTAVNLASKEDKARKKNKRRIHPTEGDYEMTDIMNTTEQYSGEEAKNNKNSISKFRIAARKSVSKANAIKVIANLKSNAAKWKKYATSKRRISQTGSYSRALDFDRKKTGGMGLDSEMTPPKVMEPEDASMSGTARREMIITHNRNLIQYFAKLGQSGDDTECINLDYVASLLENGARIDCTDKYGQTIFHEVVRAWHVDVAEFLTDHGANVNQADNYGRSPLHVAAAVDYPEMVNFLIKHGANREAVTLNEKQTPVHFAARNDACMSLKALLKAGCMYKDVRDFKQRTPLHLAAELDRSETARMLLELDDPAPAGVEDDSGQAAIVWMINKMPPVAKIALDQFHTTDRANRKQCFHLQKLEPRKAEDDRPVYPKTALQVAVGYRRLDLIIHPVFLDLKRVKWRKFGRLGAITNTVINLAFILTWTVQGILVEYDKRYKYDLPGQWWRIMLFILAILFTGWQLKDELTEYYHSKKSHGRWKQWRQKELEKDIKFAHPRWPEEEIYLRQEIAELDKQNPQYFSDFWNIFDWLCYALLLTCIITHMVDIFQHTDFVARLHIRFMSVTVILIWLRLMKNARAFALLGPFIVIITHMAKDVLLFVILYFQFYIPYACAFWMIFGENKVPEGVMQDPSIEDPYNHTVTVDGFATPSALAFTLFRLTLVDEYDYNGLKEVDSIMTDILVGTWLGLSAILMINLFIALMSDTFQRVFDNSKANAVMQKAITILNIEESLSGKRRRKFREFIHNDCAPRIDFYDDDTTDPGEQDLKKVTIQIKEQLDEMQEKWEIEERTRRRQSTRFDTEQLDELEESFRDGKFGVYNKRVGRGIGGNKNDDVKGGRRRRQTPQYSDESADMVTMDKFDDDLGQLREEVHNIRDRQEDFMDVFTRDITAIKTLLQQLVVSQYASELSVPVYLPTEESHSVVPGVTAAAPPTGFPGNNTMGDSLNTFKRETGDSEKHPWEKTEEWDNLEKQRKQDMQNLREQLAQQQILASQGDPNAILAGATNRDDTTRESSTLHTSDNQLQLTPSPSGQLSTSRRDDHSVYRATSTAWGSEPHNQPSC